MTAQRRTVSEDLRLVSESTADTTGFGWVAGVYALRLDEDNDQDDYFAQEPLHPTLVSQYSATNLALYAEAEWRVAASAVLSGGAACGDAKLGLRATQRGSKFAPRDDMWGGHLSLRGALSGPTTGTPR